MRAMLEVPISKEELERLCQTLTNKAIAKKLGVSDSTVRRWRQLYGLPRMKNGPKTRSWSLDQLKEAVESSTSVAQVLRKLGLSKSGGNHYSVVRKIREHSLSTTHFTGRGHLKGKTHNWTPAISLGKVLTERSTYSRGYLKKRLIKEGLLKYECYECGISEWQGRRLSLHIDHINGVNDDNRLKNLRLLCPNCHSLTSTWAGKNIGTYCKWAKADPNKPKRKRFRPRKTNRVVTGKSLQKNYCECGKEIYWRATTCKSCVPKPTKIDWPSDLELAKRIKSSSKLAVSKELGVSETAVRKRIKRRPGLASFLAE